MLNISFILLYNLLYKEPTPVEYTHTIERIEYETSKSQSNNNNLSSIIIKYVDFDFQKDKTKYVIEVPYSKEKLELSYKAEDSKSTVEVIGDEKLVIGNNSLAIKVTAENGTTKEYNFTIIRNEDNTILQNNLNSIKQGILGSVSEKFTVNAGSEAVTLDTKTSSALKTSGKTLIFKWTDLNGKFLSSITIDGSKIETPDIINPNTQSLITNQKLKDLMKDSEYISVSTSNSNIPKSVYRLNVDAKEELYYLYYYDRDILITKPLRVTDNSIEFEIENGIDYAITTKSKRPSTEESSHFHWIWISLFIVILFIIFFIITKYTAFKVVKKEIITTKRDKIKR